MTASERVRFDSDNTAVLLIDHQVGLFTGVRDIEIAELKHNVVGLARAAKLLGLPIVAVTTARDSLWGPTIPELVDALGDTEILDRSTVNAWDDERFVARVRQADRIPFDEVDSRPSAPRDTRTSNAPGTSASPSRP